MKRYDVTVGLNGAGAYVARCAQFGDDHARTWHALRLDVAVGSIVLEARKDAGGDAFEVSFSFRLDAWTGG